MSYEVNFGPRVKFDLADACDWYEGQEEGLAGHGSTSSYVTRSTAPYSTAPGPWNGLRSRTVCRASASHPRARPTQDSRYFLARLISAVTFSVLSRMGMPRGTGCMKISVQPR